MSRAMNCEQVQLLIGPWIDGEVDREEKTTLEAHLDLCADCREQAQTLRTHHADLVRAFEPRREAAGRLAERVIDSLAIKPPKPSVSPRARPSNWTSLLLASAVGFLIAAVLFQPWKQGEKVIDDPVSRAGNAIDSTFVAHMTVATGDVEFSRPASDSWEPMTEISTFACPSNGSVRTGKEVRCELKTADECIVRMNGETEVLFRSGRHVQLKRGQIWCLSPENVLLEVDPADENTHTTAQSPWSCTSSMVSPDGVEVGPGGGLVAVKTGDISCQLKPGETATINNGRVNVTRLQDPLLAESWMQPLLMSKGHADQELAERVDRLLARIGRSKLSTLYEHEIRSLGEFAILPLIRFLQSPESTQEPSRRMTAMRIVSDLAPMWATGDLIQLLNDDDPTVRFLSANALKRLTGLIYGCPPEKWRALSEDTVRALKRWQQWWESNQDGLPYPFIPRR